MTFVDPTADHDGCMKTFADAKIQVIINLAGSTSLKNSEWDATFFASYTSVVDSFASYDNVLAFTVGNEVIDQDPSSIGSAPSLKAAARDVKAYIKARGYRKIPVGYVTADLSDITTSLGDYLVCGGNSSDSIDFYGINLYSWCGDSSYTKSGYDVETSDLKNLPVPIFLAEDGCNQPSRRTFEDQVAIFGPNMVDIWSGAIIYEWLNDSSGYGLVSYTSNYLSGTPTTIADYTNLKSQWATLSPEGIKRSDYTFSGSTPACPTTNSDWTVEPSASLPTIPGLNFATVSPTSSQVSGSGSRTSSSATRTGTSTRAAGSGSASDAASSSDSTSGTGGLSTGAKAGIGIGAGILVVALMVVAFLLYRRRKSRRTDKKSGKFDDKAEMYAGPVDPNKSGAVRPRHELPNSNGVQRRPLPGELATSGAVRSEIQSKPRHELQGQTSSNAPWAHTTDGYMPAELHPTSIQEADTGTSRREPAGPPSPTNDAGFEASDTSTATVSGPGSSRPKSTVSSRPDPFPFDESELAEDADVAVQELGLISVRKRTLVSQANSAGVKPEDVEGRKGDEYRELMEREQRVRDRLDEIERQRKQGQR